MMRNDLIKNLKASLNDPLPGWAAQKRLMPEGRKREMLSDSLHPAAVLIALYQKNGEWVFPLIKRSSDGLAHSGQIALPGGRRDGSENNIETALREAHEEVNILPGSVEIIGQTSPLPIPVSNHLVQPIVGFLRTEPNLIPDPREVAEIFSVSIQTLLDKHVLLETRNFRGHDYEIPYFEINNHKIWGATAMILSEFRELLAQLPL
ncbi:MAG: CoA pyrophosphatase [Candidatus Marinimicrobia bacterium]|nr:CoA pyrophosphatase [Candidatus Neomarinimicrobiota bacterium]